MTLSLFDCLKEIITTKRGDLHVHPEFKKVWSTFMILRYLSMDTRFALIADHINLQANHLSGEQIYKMLVLLIPRERNSFIKYISKPKTAKKKKEKN